MHTAPKETRRLVAAAERFRDADHHVTVHEGGWKAGFTLEHPLACYAAGVDGCPVQQALSAHLSYTWPGQRAKVTVDSSGWLSFSQASGPRPAAALLRALHDLTAASAA